MYHVNEAGNAHPCNATKGQCPYGSSAQHFSTLKDAREAYEKTMGSSFAPLTLSHGQWVCKGEVGVSDFLQTIIAKAGGNHRYSGSLEQLVSLTKSHLSTAAMGTGSESGDVLLVKVPPKNFYTDVVSITAENKHRVKEVTASRIEGEEPVTKLVVQDEPLAPATFVNIVTYRADVLAKDDDRTTQDEWEIVAILAQPQEKVPMHPTTMRRNASNAKGGTKRVYTPAQWEEAEEFWANHAYADTPGATTP